MKSKYRSLLLASDGCHYSVKHVRKGTNDETASLFRSRYAGNNWTKPGSRAAKLFSDGNGFDVTFSGGKTFRLDYCQAEELRLLLNEERRADRVNWQGTPDLTFKRIVLYQKGGKK